MLSKLIAAAVLDAYRKGKYMEAAKKVKSNIKKEIQFMFELGIVIGVILSLLDAVPFLGVYRFRYLYMASRWPVGMLTGIIIAAVVMLLRRTTVLVTRDRVVIRRMGRNLQFSIADFTMPVIRRKEHHIWLIKKVSTKIYLSFSYLNGTKAYQLFEFSETDLEQVLQFIREQCSANMPMEEKLAVRDSLNNMQEVTAGGEDRQEAVSGDSSFKVFSLFPEQIRQRERRTILKIGGIWIMILAAILILLLFGFSNSSGTSFKLIFCSFLGVIMLVSVPFQLLRLSWRMKCCPEVIRIGGNAMWVGEKYVPYIGVASIRMTSPRKESDSVFPVQYWMTIKENGEKHRYYLGSQASYGEYRELCNSLEQALIMRPDKLKYRGK